MVFEGGKSSEKAFTWDEFSVLFLLVPNVRLFLNPVAPSLASVDLVFVKKMESLSKSLFVSLFSALPGVLLLLGLLHQPGWVLCGPPTDDPFVFSFIAANDRFVESNPRSIDCLCVGVLLFGELLFRSSEDLSPSPNALIFRLNPPRAESSEAFVSKSRLLSVVNIVRGQITRSVRLLPAKF